MSVADLLEQSRAAHQRSHQFRGQIDATGGMRLRPRRSRAGAEIAEALKLRLRADRLDPTHQDPAWEDDLAANRGQSSDALITFLGRYLTPIEAR